jgi:kynureninase
MPDTTDPLAHLRDEFTLPPGIIYLDGNSLGPLPKAAPARLAHAVQHEWGHDLIRSWNTAGWYELPRRLGAKIARLIGAQPHEVIVADSTSINLFKALVAALHLRPGRRVILSEPDNFPTDLYMAQGLIALLGHQHTLRLLPADQIADAIDDDTAAVLLTQVNYRTGELYDMAAITARAHAHGALAVWDLAHSAGALPVDLMGCAVDFAVGCGYKYLNGGPGAPAFIYVAERHQPDFAQPLSGWMGHAQPFAFDMNYTPAEGIARYLCGTQPVLSMTALECAVDLFAGVDMHAVRAKSLALTDRFIALVEPLCAQHGLTLITPRAHDRRGSQVALRHPDGYPIVQALIARGVIGDFRAPDILRFGFAPLYLRYQDVDDAVTILADILATAAWRAPEYQARNHVT